MVESILKIKLNLTRKQSNILKSNIPLKINFDPQAETKHIIHLRNLKYGTHPTFYNFFTVNLLMVNT